ncbi:MAG: hypothetical protein D6766_02995 [Verrucomicrobia bacterium]|nr:MAG: hypothetical protein D6766_02995 [Verrucomicrobiota bacterium]
MGLALACILASPEARTAGELEAGPLWSRHRLTLETGAATEALGPLWQTTEVWRGAAAEGLGPDEWPPADRLEDPAVVSRIARGLTLAPLFSWRHRPEVDARFFEFLYPVVTYARYGTESRFQIFQVLSFSGGRTQQGARDRTWTVFPFFFLRHSEDPNRRYAAFWPVYGRLQNRLFRDETRFVLWPLYVQTRKRDVVTDNYLVPFVHVRHGDGLKGWQVWPFYGRETKALTWVTNATGQAEAVGGHEKQFVLWPFYGRAELGLGTTNEVHQRALLPFYSALDSPARTSRTWLWPFGLSRTEDRAIGYRQTALLWPVFIRARGPGKHEDRFWPFYGETRYAEWTSRFILWPLWRQRRIERDPLRRETDQFGLVLYRRTVSRREDTGTENRLLSLWPLYVRKTDANGRTWAQAPAPLTALLPNNDKVRRLYGHFFGLWRTEADGQTGRRSTSVLWNLYRRERSPERKKCSLLFGLVQYESGRTGRRWKLFFLPLGGGGPSRAEPTTTP